MLFSVSEQNTYITVNFQLWTEHETKVSWTIKTIKWNINALKCILCALHSDRPVYIVSPYTLSLKWDPKKTQHSQMETVVDFELWLICFSYNPFQGN